MKPKSYIFCTFFENVDFAKIVLPSRRELDFWGSEPQKFERKLMQKRIPKQRWTKTGPSVNFRIHFGLQKPPKSLPKAMQNEACFARLWNSRENRRKSTGVATFGLRKWLCIWLGLLYLLIYWSAPRRPNPQSLVPRSLSLPILSKKNINPAKILPKPIQNSSQTHPKSLKIMLKSLPKAI